MSHKIVLVRPIYPRNIGMSARAMTNFGFKELILIDPKCTLDGEAREGAARGQGPLTNCKIYENWSQFLENESHSLRIAFTRREGQRRPVQPLSYVKQWIKERENPPCSFIFGPEDHGLAQEDLEHVHQLCSFEIPGDQKSMNLSHAVLYFLSQWFVEKPDVKIPSSPLLHRYPDLDRLDPQFSTLLERLGFDLSRKKWNMLIALKQLIRKAAPNEEEIRMIENLTFQSLREMTSTKDNCDSPGRS